MENGITMDMTLQQFLDYLTYYNGHSERCVVETIINGNDELISRACRVLLKHLEDGHLTLENDMERRAIYQELEADNAVSD